MGKRVTQFRKSPFFLIVGIVLILILGLVGQSLRMIIIELFESDSSESPIDNSSSSPPSSSTLINSTDLPFEERWYFDAALNKENYTLEDNLTITVNLTCIRTHIMYDYYISSSVNLFNLLRIKNSSNKTVWQPSFYRSSGLTYPNYTIQKGIKLGGTWTFSFDKTLLPPGYDDSWIPALPLGNYAFWVPTPSNIITSAEQVPTKVIFFLMIEE